MSKNAILKAIVLLLCINIYAYTYIETQSTVEEDTLITKIASANGFFSMGLPDGTPFMNGFHEPYLFSGSFLSVFIDGAIYRNIYYVLPISDAINFNDYREETYYDTEIEATITSWSVPFDAGSIDIYQIIQESVIDDEPMAYIKYKVENNTTSEHSIAIRIAYDIQLGENDAPIISADGMVKEYGQIYQEDEIPEMWQAYSESPYHEEEQYIIRGLEGDYPPDLFGFGEGGNRYGEYENLIYPIYNTDATPTPWLLNPYYDTAVLYQWVPRIVRSSDNTYFDMYIGMGKDFDPAPMDFDIIYDDATEAEIYGCSMESIIHLNANFIPKGPYLSAHNLKCKMYFNDSSELIAIESNHNLPEVARDDTVSMDFAFRIPDAYSSEGRIIDTLIFIAYSDECIHRGRIDTTFLRVPYTMAHFDETPPYFELSTSLESTICEENSLKFYLEDTDSRVNYHSARISINDQVFEPSDGIFSFRSDSIYIPIRRYMVSVSGDTIIPYGETEVCIEFLEDNHSCAISAPVCYEMNVDLQPPIITDISPESSDELRVLCDTIKINMEDEVSGIDPSSIEMSINGDLIDSELYSYEAGLLSIGHWFEGAPDSIELCIESLADDTECGNSIIEPVCFDYSVFHENQEVEIIHPEEDMVHVGEYIDSFVFDIRGGYGVVAESLSIIYDGCELPMDEIDVSYISATDSWRLTFYDIGPFEDGTNEIIFNYIYDTIGYSNSEPIEKEIEIHVCNELLIEPDIPETPLIHGDEIIVSVSSSDTFVDMGSIDVIVNGYSEILDYDISGSYSEYEITIMVPETTIAGEYGGDIEICIAGLADFWGCITEEYCFTADLLPEQIFELPAQDSPKPINIFPNPVSKYVNIDLSGSSQAIWAGIYDISGRLVIENAVRIGQEHLRFDISNEKPGVYQLIVKKQDSIEVSKIAIVK
ncbi:MAG: T9SS type A sorting domain-containing protein [Candidatus Zixiibacteriota bacterium]